MKSVYIFICSVYKMVFYLLCKLVYKAALNCLVLQENKAV